MSIKVKSIKSNYIYNMIYEAVALLTPLITTPYISRVLGASGVGVYSYTNSIANYFILFGNLGLVTYGQMAIAKVRDDEKAVTKTFFELWILRFLAVSASLVIYFVVAFSSKNYSQPLIYSSILVFASVFDFSWLFRGIEDFSKVVIRNLIVKLLCVILIFCLVRSADDLNIYILLVSLSTLLGNLTYFYSIRSVIKHVEIKGLNILQHFKPCMVYFIPTIATSVYKLLDKFMLGYILQETTQNGYYEQAHKIEQILIVTVTSLNTIMRSRMTFLYKEGKLNQMHQYLEQSISYILMISIPMTCGLVVVAPNFIPLFLGDGFEESIILLQIFAFLIIIIGLSNCLNTHFLAPSGRQGKNNVVLIFGAIINFSCNLLLIPKYKAIGAATASVFAETLILVGYLHLSNDFIRFRRILKLGWKYLIAGICMGIIVWMISRMNLSPIPLIFCQICSGIISYFGILLVFRDRFLLNAVRATCRKFLHTK